MTINVIQRNGNVNGKNLEHFIKKYWQALCPIPKNSNPAWDNNGGKDEPFNNNVGENLFMLSFSRNPQQSVTRTIQVPSDKGLFIPIMSVVVSACEKPSRLIEIANKDQSSVDTNSLSLELDGSQLNNLPSYVFNPAALGSFSVNFPTPQESIFTITGSGPCNAVAAGRYVWTHPLDRGDHTVRFKGNLRCNPPDCIDTEYMEDVTYNITVQ